jgi:hypothetical protein
VQFEDGDVEGTAAEVVDGDESLVSLVEPVGERGGSLSKRSTSRPARRPASRVAWRWLSLKYAGTVMTTLWTASPNAASARRFNSLRMHAETSGGVYGRPWI